MACLCLATLTTAQAKQARAKKLPVPGEVFLIEGHSAFLIKPSKQKAGPQEAGRQKAGHQKAGKQVPSRPLPWVWYAPTLPRLPAIEEKWMFDKFLAAGIAIAGVDVGESYGNPSGRSIYSALHRELVTNHGLATRACLLARSRGGLMLYNWAVENPASVQCIAGIYPVCNLNSYPGIKRASPAYAMTAEQLSKSLQAHNPIARLAPLAKAKVPIFHIHGDQDRVVPLLQNSAELHKRYTALKGPMQLRIIKGQGHNMWSGWFQNQELVDFIITQAKLPPTDQKPSPKRGTTKGIIDIDKPGRPADALVLVGDKRSTLIPEKASSECLWVFADGVLTASPKWDSVITKASYRDFRLHLEFNVNASENANPEAKGNSGVYIQQRYELQILDSYGVSAADYKSSFCGSLYRLKKPDQITSKKAGEWQSFDIVFRAARFDGDKKTENARITAYQNGVLIHDDFELPRKTGAGQKEGPQARPIKLQGHHNQVRFRDVWIQAINL